MPTVKMVPLAYNLKKLPNLKNYQIILNTLLGITEYFPYTLYLETSEK